MVKAWDGRLLRLDEAFLLGRRPRKGLPPEPPEPPEPPAPPEPGVRGTIDALGVGALSEETVEVAARFGMAPFVQEHRRHDVVITARWVTERSVYEARAECRECQEYQTLELTRDQILTGATIADPGTRGRGGTLRVRVEKGERARPPAPRVAVPDPALAATKRLIGEED